MNELTLEIITIDNIQYFSSKQLKKKDPIFFRGVRSLKNIISKKNIPEDEYIFGFFSKTKNRWKIYSKKTNIASRFFPLISVKWCYENIPSFEDNDLEEKLQMAPPILKLNDDEKFKDSFGNIYEIETRGNCKDKDSVYFLCKDVSNAFGIKSASDTIFKSNHFIENKHYVNFICLKTFSSGISNNIKCLFLTYQGFLKLLYRSNCEKAKSFQNFNTSALFTIQMGTREEKEELMSEILGASIKHVKTMSKVNVSNICCVYIFSLGHVRDLRKSMNIKKEINDNYIVVKFGMTNNLSRRANEHLRCYEQNIENAKLRLMYYNFIDKKYIREAEKKLKEFFLKNDSLLQYKNHKELAVLNPSNKKNLKPILVILTNFLEEI